MPTTHHKQRDNTAQTLTNGRMVGLAGKYWLRLDENRCLTHLEPVTTPIPPEFQDNLQDLQGDLLSLGGLDLQINGGLGLAFPEVTPADLPKLKEICAYLWEQGVDGFCPTIVTTSQANIRRSLAVFAELWGNPEPNLAQVLGLHLEGPFLNYEKRGAHPAQYLQPLTLKNLQRVIGEFAPLIKIVTLAPELDPSHKCVEYLNSLGIVVSLGHSLATEAEANQAFASGATMVTHAFNAMPSLHHREAGLLGAAMVYPDVYCGFIADGQHVNRTMLEIFLRAAKQPFLVSDALAPIGLPDGVYPWDDRQITVTHGTARLDDGTLSGTTLPLFAGVKNLVQWGICNLEQAIAYATIAPRKALGIPIWTTGKPIHLLRWQAVDGTVEFSRI
ncbi:N-acetylglucosamine-6-phosphate deacetylase [Synechococcus moorigangaii CMS01]|nr:N-acetylglucosamine-6-phosphate deacetylase [Synechococcus moorigangaii CMS01]